MSDNPELFEMLHDIVASIDPKQSNADWGRDFGLAIYETGEEDLIVYVLSDAGEKYRSAELSKMRKKSANAAQRLMSSTNGERAEAVSEQLEMPIVVAGFPPLPLGQANHYFLVDACAAGERLVKGLVRNLRFWQRARDVSEPWPEDSIRSLIDSGRIKPEQLVVDEAVA